eukprot:jgi/Bigna1/75039/fgenesh1_pg.32_\
MNCDQGGFTPPGFGPCHARNPIQTSSEAPQKTSGRVRRSRIVQKGVQKSGFSREKIEGKNFGCRGKGPLCALAQKNMLRGRVKSNSVTSRSSTPKFAKLNVSAPKKCFFLVVLTLVSFRCVAPSGLHGADAAINEAGCDARRAAPELLGIGRTSKTCGRNGAHWHTLNVKPMPFVCEISKFGRLPASLHWGRKAMVPSWNRVVMVNHIVTAPLKTGPFKVMFVGTSSDLIAHTNAVYCGSRASYCKNLWDPNSNTDWDTLDSRTGQVAWGDGEVRTFSLQHPVDYKCYRAVFTNDNYNNGEIHCVSVDYLGFRHYNGTASPSTLSPVTSSPNEPTTSPTVVNRSPYFDVNDRPCTNSTGQSISCPSLEDAHKECAKYGQGLCSKADGAVQMTCANCYFYRDSLQAYFNCPGNPTSTCGLPQIHASCCTYASVRFVGTQPPQYEQLLAWYKFEGNYNDSSIGTGTRYNGYGVGVASTPRTAGSVDSRALRVEANVTSDVYSTSSLGYARFPHGPQPKNGVTVAAWVKSAVPNMYPGLMQLVSKYTAYILGSTSTNSRNICFLVFRVGGSWTDNSCVMVPEREVTNWNHFVGTFNVTTGESVFYFNGEVTQTVANSPGEALFNDTGPLEIGQREGRDHGDFNGWIDDVMIYDVPLNATEVRELFVSYKTVEVTRTPTTVSPHSNAPSTSPQSNAPSSAPSRSPSTTPSSSSPHSNAPSSAPSCSPSATPSSSPHSIAPSSTPSCSPSATPSSSPSSAPLTYTTSPVTSSPGTGTPITSSPVTAAPAASSNAPSSTPSCSPSIAPSPSPSSAPLTYTTSPVTSAPTASPITASPATVAPATSSPGTVVPTTSSPVTAAPATSSPSAVALEVLRDCIQVQGPSSGWAHATLTFRMEALCKTYPVSSMWWRYDPEGSSPISTSSQLTLTSRNLTMILGGQPSSELLIHACALFNGMQVTVCKPQTATIYHRPSPAITVEAPEPFRPSAEAWIQAHISHPDPRNITAGQRASFSYAWKLYAKSRDGLVYPVPWSAVLTRGAFKADMRSAYGNDRPYFAVNLTVQTLASPLVAVIGGGAVRDVRAGEPYQLDGSGSYDPDFARGGEAAWLWSCERRAAGSPWESCLFGLSSRLSSRPELSASLMQAGHTLRLSLNYSVGTEWVNRTATTSAMLVVRPGAVPDVALREHPSVLSVSGNLHIIADAYSSSAALRGGRMIYNWSVTAAAGGGAISTVNTPSRATLQIQASQLGVGTFTFTVGVTDVLAGTTAGASTSVTIASVPDIASLTVTPPTGRAYSQSFQLETVASSDLLPLRYLFGHRLAKESSSLQLLSSFASSNVLTLTLPAGNLTLLTIVRDAIGGEASRSVSGVAVTTPVSNDDAGQGGGGSSDPVARRQLECNRTHAAVTELRAVIDSSSTLPPSQSSQLHVADAVTEMLLALELEERFTDALRTIGYSLDIAQLIPSDSIVRISACEGNLATIVEGQGTSGTATATTKLIADLAGSIWTVLDTKMNSLAASPTMISGAGAQGTQTLAELTASPSANTSARRSITQGKGRESEKVREGGPFESLSHSRFNNPQPKYYYVTTNPILLYFYTYSIERLANTTGLLLEAADPEELSPTSPRGRNTAQTLSNLLSLSSSSLDAGESRPVTVRSRHAASIQVATQTPASRSISAECQAVNGVLDLFDRLLQLASNALPPEGDPVTYDTSNFQAGALKAFADATAHATVGNTTVVVPPLTQSSSSSLTPSSTREEQRITISSIAANVSAVRLCRPAVVASQADDGAGRMLSSLNSVNLYTRNASSGGGSTNNGSSNGVTRSSDERVTTFAPGQSVSIIIPLLDNSAAAREDAGCYFWDSSLSKYSDEGCRLNWTTGTATTATTTAATRDNHSAACVCSHLTEFAVVAHHRDKDREDDPDKKGEPSRIGYVYIASSALYIVIGGFASYQVWRLYNANKINLSEWRTLLHMAVIATSVLRVISSLLLSGIAKSFSAADDVHPAYLLVLLALPYSILFWVFSYPAFQWVSVVHNKKLSKNPFENVKRTYIIVNVFGMALAWSLFGYFAFTTSNPIYPSTCVTSIYAALTCSIMFYGLRISNMMLGAGAAGLAKRKRNAAKFRTRAMATSGCHLLQGAMFVLSAIFYRQHETLMVMTGVYYTAEVIALSVLLKLYWKTINRVVATSLGSRKSPRGRKKADIGSMRSVGSSGSSRYALDDSRDSIALQSMDGNGSRSGSYDNNNSGASSRPWRPSTKPRSSKRSGLENALPSYHGRLGLISTQGINARETLARLPMVGAMASYETIDEKLDEESATLARISRNGRSGNDPLSDIKESSVNHSMAGGFEVGSVALGDSVAI